jgi:hypothetical protein
VTAPADAFRHSPAPPRSTLVAVRQAAAVTRAQSVAMRSCARRAVERATALLAESAEAARRARATGSLLGGTATTLALLLVARRDEENGPASLAGRVVLRHRARHARSLERPPATSRPVPTRTFTDGDGLHWTLSERDARHVPGARGERCLILENDAIVRRLWVYPADWSELPTEALMALASLAGRGSGRG